MDEQKTMICPSYAATGTKLSGGRCGTYCSHIGPHVKGDSCLTSVGDSCPACTEMSLRDHVREARREAGID